MSVLSVGVAQTDSNKLDTPVPAEDDKSDVRRYYRVWKQIDVAGDGASRFVEMLTTVFNNLALRVTLDAAPVPDTHVAAFVDKLREKPSLFFAPLQEAPALRAATGVGATPPPPA